MHDDLSYEILLKKKMHPAEIYKNWIYIPAKIRKDFPLGKTVMIKAGNSKIRMRISVYAYMWPETLLWSDFAELIDFDKRHDTLMFIKHEDGVLEIAVEKTRPASPHSACV